MQAQGCNARGRYIVVLTSGLGDMRINRLAMMALPRRHSHNTALQQWWTKPKALATSGGMGGRMCAVVHGGNLAGSLQHNGPTDAIQNRVLGPFIL